MGWVRFTADFDWSPPELNGVTTLAYRDGTKALVRRECELAAVAAGKAVRTTRKGEGHGENNYR